MAPWSVGEALSQDPDPLFTRDAEEEHATERGLKGAKPLGPLTRLLAFTEGVELHERQTGVDGAHSIFGAPTVDRRRCGGDFAPSRVESLREVGIDLLDDPWLSITNGKGSSCASSHMPAMRWGLAPQKRLQGPQRVCSRPTQRNEGTRPRGLDPCGTLRDCTSANRPCQELLRFVERSRVLEGHRQPEHLGQRVAHLLMKIWTCQPGFCGLALKGQRVRMAPARGSEAAKSPSQLDVIREGVRPPNRVGRRHGFHALRARLAGVSALLHQVRENPGAARLGDRYDGFLGRQLQRSLGSAAHVPGGHSRGELERPALMPKEVAPSVHSSRRRVLDGPPVRRLAAVRERQLEESFDLSSPAIKVGAGLAPGLLDDLVR